MGSLLQETYLRMLIFVFSIMVFLFISYLLPFRSQKKLKKRLLSNVLLGFLNSLIIKILIPFSLVQLASLSHVSGWGLFNSILPVENSNIILVMFSVLLLDVLIYWQHRITHIVPFLWRFHRVHHTDIGFDTTSGVRFHPIEILISYIVKAGFIVAFGIPAVSILIFEIILSTSSLFNHSNFSIPRKFERVLRVFIVTPTMHRIHHSTKIKETNSNYSFSLSIWDRVFSSYTECGSESQKAMDIGLEEYREEQDQGFISLLVQPFTSKGNV